MMRRRLKNAAWMSAAMAFSCAVLFAWSLAKPSWVSRGTQTAGVVNGRIEIAWASDKIVRHAGSWTASDPYFQQGNFDVTIRPRSSWKPSIVDVRGIFSPTGFGITVLFIPLWPCALLLGSLAALLWRCSSKAFPGHCRQCGYDLEGLAAERCPECGTPRSTWITRLAGRFSALCSNPIVSLKFCGSPR